MGRKEYFEGVESQLSGSFSRTPALRPDPLTPTPLTHGPNLSDPFPPFLNFSTSLMPR